MQIAQNLPALIAKSRYGNMCTHCSASGYFARIALRCGIALLFCCMLPYATALHAETLTESTESPVAAQMRLLETDLQRLHQKQQNIFQQFQMIQELRRYELMREGEITPSMPPAMVMGGPLPSYEEMAGKREERHKRLERYTADLDQLYAQYQELENEKKYLMQQIDALSRSLMEQLTK
ncbi:conserved hypothetical protein [Nitrosomonas nitrosa]|uniref:Uncharacterized protein n=3 Tax=Nitrosomonas nitrosa TaxID=52442 RepID=A0A8H9D9F8_9PROT|nr:conserved hypothetical protein [Nitrosomonas nitrosa]